jgi:hypothetical protein
MISIRKGGLESITHGRSGTRHNFPTCAGKRKEQDTPAIISHAPAYISSMISFCQGGDKTGPLRSILR